MGFQAAINNAPSLRSFQTEATKNEAVALKKDGLQAQPAKLGFFGRVMQWIRGENPARINSDTKKAFVAAMSSQYGGQAANDALQKAGFDHGSDQPLTSREIKAAIQYVKKAGDGEAGSPGGRQVLSDLRKTHAEGQKLLKEEKKLRATLLHCQKTQDPRLGAVQKKLAETQQAVEQVRSKLAAQTSQSASGGLPASTAGHVAKSPGNEAPVGKNKKHAEMRHAERAQRREQRTQDRLQSSGGVQLHRQKTLASGETQLARLRNMVGEEMPEASYDEMVKAFGKDMVDAFFGPVAGVSDEAVAQLMAELEAQADGQLALGDSLSDFSDAALAQQMAELQAEVDEQLALSDAVSNALARPFGRR